MNEIKKRYDEETLDAVIDKLRRYEDRKNREPEPKVIPSASPSRSHWRERRQGFLSGILHAITIIEKLKAIKETK